MISLADVRQAQQRIRSYVKRTPLVRSRTLSEMLGANVYLKLEIFQTTGAFKVRGAFNKVLSVPENQRGKGLVAAHAQRASSKTGRLFPAPPGC